MPRLLLLAAALSAALLLGALWLVLGDDSATSHAGFDRGTESPSATTSALASVAMPAPTASGAIADSSRLPLAHAPSPAEPARTPNAKPRVLGRVVDREGHPVAGATVRAAPHGGSRSLPLELELDAFHAQQPVVEAVTDADGAYAFDGLASGLLRVAVRARGFAVGRTPPITLPRGYDSLRVADVVLAPGARVAGRVVDERGEPVEGARVLLAIDDLETRGIAVPGRGVPLAVTSADGAFDVDELAPGAYCLLFDAPTFRVAQVRGRADAPEAECPALIVQLARGAGIRGKLEARDGMPPGPIRVRARRVDPKEDDEEAPPYESAATAPLEPADARGREAACDAEGRFVLQGLADGVEYRLTAWTQAEGECAWKRLEGATAPLARAGDGDVEIRYAQPSSLTFRVVDARTRAALETFTVWAGAGRDGVLRDERNEPRRAHPGGRVRVDRLRAERGKPSEMRVRAAGYRDLVTRGIELVPGRELDLGDVALEPELSVLVRVLDDRNGAGIAGARVWIASEPPQALQNALRSPPERDHWADTAVQFGRTGPNGEARLTSDPGRTVAIAASAVGFAPSEIQETDLPLDADHALTLRLSSGATVRARVTDGEGAVPDVQVQARLPRSRWDAPSQVPSTWARTDADGVASFTSLAAGAYALRAHDPSEEGESEAEGWVDATVSAGESREVALTVAPRAALSGRVLEAGRPVESAQLKLVRAARVEAGRAGDEGWISADDSSAAISGADGRFHFRRVAHGEYAVFVSHSRRHMSVRFDVSVRADRTDLELALDAARVEGRITDPDGRALAGIAVHTERARRGRDPGRPHGAVLNEDERGVLRTRHVSIGGTTERTDAAGRYALRGLASGEELSIGAGGEDYERKTSAPMMLARDEVRTGVDFVLRAAGSLRLELAGAGVQRDASASRPPWYEVRAELLEEGRASRAGNARLNAANRRSVLSSLAPGRYRVTCAPRSRDRSLESVQECEVVSGVTTSVTFEIP